MKKILQVFPCLLLMLSLFSLPAMAVGGYWSSQTLAGACNPGGGCNNGLSVEKLTGYCPTKGAVYYFFRNERQCPQPACRITIVIYEQNCI